MQAGKAVQARLTAVEEMFGRVRDAVGSRLAASRSYDYYSRQAAIDKLHAMSVQVGTPDILTDRKFLKIMYKDLAVQKTDFFQNIQYGLTFLRRREEHALVSPGEETRWLPALRLNRVSYVPAANKVVIPELLLQPPLFLPGFPLAVQLGGLGVMLAEAVVEGVAGAGAVFSPAGRILDSAVHSSNYTLARPAEPNSALVRGARCLVQRFTQLRLDTPDLLAASAVDSARSVAGLAAAYTALAVGIEQQGGQLLPALEHLDPQAVFFLQFGQSVCEASTLAQRDLDRTLSHRLLGRERLRGLVSQFPQFRHFNFCSEESRYQCDAVL